MEILRVHMNEKAGRRCIHNRPVVRQAHATVCGLNVGDMDGRQQFAIGLSLFHEFIHFA
jgi:hypothetical protein